MSEYLHIAPDLMEKGARFIEPRIPSAILDRDEHIAYVCGQLAIILSRSTAEAKTAIEPIDHGFVDAGITMESADATIAVQAYRLASRLGR